MVLRALNEPRVFDYFDYITLDDGARIVAAEQVIAPLVPATDEEGWLRGVAVMGAVEAASNGKHVPGADAGHGRCCWTSTAAHTTRGTQPPTRCTSTTRSSRPAAG